TQTLRDKVWSVLNNVWVGDSEADLYIKTDAILDLVREALLSPEAVEAACSAMYLLQSDVDWTEGERQCTRDGITAALDAVTGEGDR
ncbi:hypothetical protein JYB64_24685, partial [Algoriphagus aestuarii]|nr:hypothetical protein [Algoriphagus aestuarii]